MSQAMSSDTTDGMLQEWGTRLFLGMPKKPKAGATGKLSAAGAVGTAPLIGAGSVRAQIQAAVRPNAKQVLVKITGGGRGMKAVAAHFRYISRLGKEEVGGKGQTLELEDKNGDKVVGREGLEGLQYDWRVAGSYIPDESHRREVFNIVLSMPEGTPARDVHAAARDFARETFEGHKYVFALHDDTGSPHVHLAVRAERMDGVRLNPRKADLASWRERFAARLQDRGIHAVATRAATRGVAKVAQKLWRVKASEQQRERRPRPAVRSEESVRLGRQRAVEAWGQLASALRASSDDYDQVLARAVHDYIAQTFGDGREETAGDRGEKRLARNAVQGRSSGESLSESDRRKDRGEDR